MASDWKTNVYTSHSNPALGVDFSEMACERLFSLRYPSNSRNARHRTSLRPFLVLHTEPSCILAVCLAGFRRSAFRETTLKSTSGKHFPGSQDMWN
ncbi:hypothetical protein BJV74DRAFT_837254 [Russula compacta]|nr:hypothetical protein BJV74DRAFT_837254 [Russula compacta]